MSQICCLQQLEIEELNGGRVLTLELQMNAGEIVCLHGPPGTGKSLILQALMGFVPIKAGVAELLGENVSSLFYDDLMRLRGHVGYSCIHAPPVSNLTVEQNIEVPLCMHGVDLQQSRERTREILREFNIESKAKLRLASLTAQEKHLLSIARAFAMPVDFFILGEPFRAMSSDLIALVEAAMLHRCEANKSILFCTDKPEFARRSGARIVEMTS